LAAKIVIKDRRKPGSPLPWNILAAFVLLLGAAGNSYALWWRPLRPAPAPVLLQTEFDIGRTSKPLSASELATLKPKDSFKECPDCPEMVVVPAGSFTMGAPPLDTDSFSDERPPHQVTFAKPFAVGKVAVTFVEWEVCVSGGACGDYRLDDRGWGRANRPVIDVSWEDAKSYAAWLSNKTGKPYRLLSEAEWEYAARAGTVTRYFWGDEIGSNRANCKGCGSQWGNQTAPVGSFAPNAFGLYDMHGNVWQWIEDCRNDSYDGAPRDGSAWKIGDCARRVLRGGSWFSGPRNLRAANRSGRDTRDRNDAIGFRLARTLNP
jgi:formylglycine-generating enzyme required for sulfatase activity